MIKKTFMLTLLLLMTNAGYTQEYPSVVKKYDMQLVEDIQFNPKQGLKKSFQSNEIEGWLRDKGDWHIKGMVKHHRLRCATYELGVQLGKGNPACINIEWLTDIEYGTLRKHCNSAPLQHVGGGDLPELRNILKEVTCARVVVRCTGICGNTE